MTADTEYSPLRPGLFERWLVVWHVVYIGGLLAALAFALWNTRGVWGWREAALVAVVATLIVAYARVLIFEKRWPHPTWFLALYFSFALALLGLAAWLNPIFVYVIGMLFGQLFAIMPPVLVVPGVLAVLGVIVFSANGWQLPAVMNWAAALSIGAQAALALLLYFYIYHVFRTSQERAGLVNELRAANEQLARAHEQQRELILLRERERMARDLHDGLGHSLVALSVQLEAVQRLYPVDPDRASAQIDDMKRLTRDSMAELRRTLDALRAPDAADQSLREAIEHLCATLAARAGLKVSWRIDDNLNPPPPVAETLWRVAQEALANVERHAAATAVTLALDARPDALTLTITDDGRGLPPDAETRPGHYGLRGMRERVESLGGTLTLLSNDAGTTVTARVPVISSSVTIMSSEAP
jgi:signal transduction histidine kinase